MSIATRVTNKCWVLVAAFVFLTIATAVQPRLTHAATSPMVCGIQDGIVLWEHDSYRGTCATIPWFNTNPGFYREINLVTRLPKGFDNKVSSVQFVGSAIGRAQLMLYDTASFGGSVTVLRRSDLNLGNNRIGHDRASAAVIRPLCPLAPAGVVLYDQRGYRGNCLSLFPSGMSNRVANLETLKFNDRAASIEVGRLFNPYGQRCGSVDLFVHGNYNGGPYRFNVSDTDLSDNVIGNYRASSIIAVTPCRVSEPDRIDEY